MIKTISMANLGVKPRYEKRRFLNPGEIDVLLALVRTVAPRVMIEIGVNEGRTAKEMLQWVPSLEQYVGIDVPPGYVTAKEVQRQEVPDKAGYLASYDQRFELIVRPRGSLDLGPGDLPRCDVVFIDGDHGREALLHDTALARYLVRPGGLIIWHDYHELGTVDVKAVLDEFYELGADLWHVEGTWIVYERRPR